MSFRICIYLFLFRAFQSFFFILDPEIANPLFIFVENFSQFAFILALRHLKAVNPFYFFTINHYLLNPSVCVHDFSILIIAFGHCLNQVFQPLRYCKCYTMSSTYPRFLVVFHGAWKTYKAVGKKQGTIDFKYALTYLIFSYCQRQKECRRPQNLWWISQGVWRSQCLLVFLDKSFL